MKRETDLAKNTFILSIGSFLPKLVAMITVPLLTAYLSATEYGTYDLVITLVALLLPAVTLQIQSAAFRFLINTRDDIQKSKEIITNIFAFTIPASLLALFIMLFSLHKLNINMLLMISAYFFVNIILVGIRQITRGIGDNLSFAIDSILNSMVMLSLTALGLLVFKNGLLGVLIALAGSDACSVLFLSYRIHILQYIDIKSCSTRRIRELLNYSWPMVPNNLSGWILSLSDRMVITAFLGVEANALYAVANKIPNLLKTFQSTFTFAWQENASLSVNDKDSSKYYSKMVDGITCLITGGIGCLIAVTPILFPLLIRGDYADAYFQMPILYLGAYFSAFSSVLGGIYIANMKTKNVGMTTILAAACNLLIDVLLVKKIGIYAGSISTLISYLFLSVYRMIDVRRFCDITYNFKRLVLCLFSVSLMAVLSYLKMRQLDIFNVLFALIITYAFNRTVINAIIKRLFKR